MGAGGEFAVMPVLLLLYPNQNADLLARLPLALVFFTHCPAQSTRFCLIP